MENSKKILQFRLRINYRETFFFNEKCTKYTFFLDSSYNKDKRNPKKDAFCSFLNTEIVEYVLLDHLPLLLQSLHRDCIEEIEDHSKDCAGCIDSQSHPPKELLMQLLLEILEYQQTNSKASQGTRQMRHIRHRWRRCVLHSISRVDRKANITRSCGEKQIKHKRLNG